MRATFETDASRARTGTLSTSPQRSPVRPARQSRRDRALAAFVCLVWQWPLRHAWITNGDDLWLLRADPLARRPLAAPWTRGASADHSDTNDRPDVVISTPRPTGGA